MNLPQIKDEISEKLQKSTKNAFAHFVMLVTSFCAAVTSGTEVIFEEYSHQTKKDEILNMMTVKFITKTNDWFYREIKDEEIIVYMCNDPKNDPTNTVTYRYKLINQDQVEIIERTCD